MASSSPIHRVTVVHIPPTLLAWSLAFGTKEQSRTTGETYTGFLYKKPSLGYTIQT